MNRVLAVVLAVSLLGACDTDEAPDPGERPAALTGIRFLADADSPDFARAFEARPFVFPDDHGPHPEYRTEWWYFTGNLTTAQARHFGFELTFFRIALSPEAPQLDSAWTDNSIWMAHFAVTDTSNGLFRTAERLSRGGLDLAGATAKPFDVWVESWSAEEQADGSLRLHAASDDASVDLSLEGLERITPQGNSGLDAKGAEPGNASYYYSAPRLQVSGNVRVAAEPAESVTGTAWLDREWGTSALSGDVEGWDWFALQLDDGRDIMYYRLRESNGGASPYSNGTITYADGHIERLDADDVELSVDERWESPVTGTIYPVGWRLEIAGHELSLKVEPYLRNQEVDLTVRYWEGAIRVSGEQAGDAVAGQGYLELAGYR